MSQSIPGFIALIKETWSLFTSKLKPIFFLNLVFLAFYIILMVVFVFISSITISFEVLSRIFANQLGSSELATTLISMLPQLVALIILLIVAISFVGSYYTAAMTYLLNGKDEAVGKLLGLGKTKIIPVFVLGLVVFILSLGSFWLFVVPSLIISYLLMFSFYEVVLGNKTLIESLTRSGAIVWQNFWGILGRLVLLGLTTTIISAILSGGNEEGRSFLSSIFDIVAGWFTTVYSYILYKHASKLTSSKAKANLVWIVVPSVIGLMLMVVGIVFVARLGIASGAFEDFFQNLS